MSEKQLHQVVDSMLVGDATSAQVFLIRQWLREIGFVSNIYSFEWDDRLQGEVQAFDINVMENEAVVIFHHAIGSNLLRDLCARNVPLILIYHNITPPQFFSSLDFGFMQAISYGRDQLEQIQPITELALSDSPYSEQELVSVGFEKHGVLPIALDLSHYDMPLDDELFALCRAKGPLLLFVGRIVPNKRQEDLIKLLYYYRRIEPQARLVLVGSLQAEEYVAWLKDLAGKLDLSDAVTFTGHVTQQQMVTYYRAADVFLSMSEHEGFGKPLIESMYLELPVMAYASTAVPSTLNGAGVLFQYKDYEALAEMVDMLMSDQYLRRRIIAGQTRRVQDFLEPNVKQQWYGYLEQLNIL